MNMGKIFDRSYWSGEILLLENGLLSFFRRKPHFWILALQMLVLLCFVRFTSQFECLNDDAFITFRYSKNLGEGNGWVFNSGERVLGTTTPLWSLVLAIAPSIGLPVEWMAKFLSTIFIFASGAMLCIYFNRIGKPIAGLGSAVCLMFTPVLIICWGNEIPLMLALLIASVVLADKRYFIWAGITAGLCALTRGEGALLCIFLAVRELVRRDWRSALKVSIGPAIIGFVWLAFSIHYFGNPLPNTLWVKRWQGDYTSLWSPYRTSIIRDVRALFNSDLFGMIFLLGLLPFMRKIPWSLVIPCCAIIGAYTWLNPPAQYMWYFYPQQLLIALIIGLSIQAIFQFVQHKSHPGMLIPSLFMVVAVLILLARFEIKTSNPGVSGMRGRFERYYDVSTKIKEAGIAPSDSVLMSEVGIIGYYSEATVLDIFGLVNRLAPETLAKTEKLIEKYNPAYIVTGGEELAKLENSSGLSGRLQLLFESQGLMLLKADQQEKSSALN